MLKDGAVLGLGCSRLAVAEGGFLAMLRGPADDEEYYESNGKIYETIGGVEDASDAVVQAMDKVAEDVESMAEEFVEEVEDTVNAISRNLDLDTIVARAALLAAAAVALGITLELLRDKSDAIALFLTVL